MSQEFIERKVYSVFAKYKDTNGKNQKDLIGVGEDFESAKIIAESRLDKLKANFKNFKSNFYPSINTWFVDYGYNKCEIQIDYSIYVKKVESTECTLEENKEWKIFHCDYMLQRHDKYQVDFRVTFPDRGETRFDLGYRVMSLKEAMMKLKDECPTANIELVSCSDKEWLDEQTKQYLEEKEHGLS